MSRRLPLLAVFALAILGSRSPAQQGYAYRTQSAEPPLADDPDAAKKIQLAMAQRNPPPSVMPVRTLDTPSPTVVLRVQAPAALPTGQDVEVRLVIENLSRVPAKNVSVVYALQNAGFVKSLPVPADQPGGSVVWKFETLAAGGRQEIVLTVKPPPGVAEFESKARVIVDQEQTAKTKFAQAAIKITKTGPSKALQYDILVFGVTVTNPSDIELHDVTVQDKLPAGLVHRPNEDQERLTQGAAKITSAITDQDQTRTWRIDRLGPRETRHLEYHVFAATAPPGPIKHQVFAQAGAGAQDTATDSVELVEPKLELKAEAPPRKAANVPATVRISVTNTGPRLLQNILVTDLLDPCKVENVGGGGQTLQNRVQWIVPSLGPNRTQVLELTVSKADGGAVRHKVSAVYRGHTPPPAEAATEFEAVAALAYDFRGSPTTVEVGGEVAYEITVQNNGSAAATNIRPVIQLPAEMTLVKAEPENKADGGKVVFEPIPTLPPKGHATFRVTAKAMKPSVGARAIAELGGDPFPTGPVTRQEMTAIGANPTAPANPPPAGNTPLPVPVAPPGH
jgi:uncharacterized repeat protein (TIGR01451 family)